MELGFRADLIVENKVVVEIKSVEAIAPVHKKQLLTYLRLTDKRLGLADQLQCGIDQEWNLASCEYLAGMRSHAKAQRRKGTQRETVTSSANRREGIPVPPLGDMSAEEFRRFGHEIIDWIAELLRTH